MNKKMIHKISEKLFRIVLLGKVITTVALDVKLIMIALVIMLRARLLRNLIHLV